MMHLIDRRLDGRNKSALNRARFLRRYKEHIRSAVRGLIAERSITDMDKGGEVSVPAKDLAEPSFRHDGGGNWEVVHPGNREFVKGDKIRRPDGSGDGAVGGGEPGTGRSEAGSTLSSRPPRSAALHAAGRVASRAHAPIGGVPGDATPARFARSRSRSSRSGMAMSTGHTSWQAPHNVDARGRSANS